ncbi:hypothetical protein V2J09_019407 [Rumex salicifolius]
MPLACSKETLVWLFLNATSAFKLIFFFSFLFFPFSFNLFSSLFRRSGEYDLYDEEDDLPEVVLATEEEEEGGGGGFGYYSFVQRDLHQHLVPNVLEDDDEQGLFPRSTSSSDDFSQFEEPNESFQVDYLDEEEIEEEAMEEEEVIVEDITGREDSYLDEDFEPNHKCPSPLKSVEIEVEELKLPRDDEFLMYAASRGEIKKQLVMDTTVQDHQKRHVIFDDEPYADSCTVGSTSKDSSDWRSSITFRDSCTEDPFSSSSRRSCPKWESYTVFQKYDEEMTFLDRISAQKLQETESFKSLQVEPRSMSQRFVHQFTTTTVSRDKINPPLQEGFHLSSNNNNPYHELEAAYVAQVCLAWEALSWDYNNFRRKKALLRQQGTSSDLGCPAQVAQQFQQFQVLLQRYVETEPYEYGKRPEIYARMRRSVAPKLLLVPEYQDYEEQQGESSRITSASFLELIEDSIQTFMNFLSADGENPYHIVLKSFFKKKRKKGSVDPALVKVLKKANTKKKLMLKELQKPGKSCVKKKKNLTKEEEMEILMGLIDLKLVSRVLRMWDLTDEKLRWCEEKMTKLSLSNQGKLQRDSTPLFFPAH